MNSQEILDNAPEGATHFDDEYSFYWRMNRDTSTVFSPLSNSFEYYEITSDFLRSLADIKRITELEEEKLHMQISMTCVRELLSVISAFIENIEPRSSEAVTTYNQCMEVCHAIDEMDLPEFEFRELKEQGNDK